ncbi:MAG: sodium:solute symporter family protein [Bdellovibrionaceae bacterium]|nr:sodium:solute symporter family protein [Pseudobdellovibrionaceae bacterium]
MNTFFIVALVLYLAVLMGIAIFSQRKVHNEEDFLIGGRSFNLWVTTLCLFATWFGAGTLIAATDEVAEAGLRVTALEPVGAGFCLILAGIFFAKPLWDLKITTYSDFFRQKFGKTAESLSVFINIPIYVGWVAVQYMVLANILHIFFPSASISLLIFLVCFVTMLLTLMGGLWSVSLTDSFQLVLIILGLVYLLFKVLSLSEYGPLELLSFVPEEQKVFIPTDKAKSLFGWVSLFSIAAIGNLTGQDLAQRIFSANKPSTAQKGCIIAGVTYLIIGCIPVFLGLTAKLTMGQVDGPIIPMLIKKFLDPVSGTILSITIFSAVVSTITAALLAPASLLSHNFLVQKFPNRSKLQISRLSVVFIALISLLTALAGENVYSLLENSYAIGLVAFFVPVVMGLFTRFHDELACLVTIVLSTAIWCLEFIVGGDFPYALFATLIGFPIYFATYYLKKKWSSFKIRNQDPQPTEASAAESI